MLVKIYTCIMMVYFLALLYLAVDKKDHTFELIGLAFIMWIPLIGRVMEFW